MRIVTHNGHFHTDDLFAVATLLLIYPEAEVVRSRDTQTIESGDIVVDVGLEYDAEKRRFDHHQPEGAGKRENGIPYASFGLVWKEYGKSLCGGEEEFQIIDEKLVAPIDAIDSGIKLALPIIGDLNEYTIGDFFQSFAYDADSPEALDKIFFEILPLVKDLLKRELAHAQKLVIGIKEVEKAYEESEDKRIVVLPRSLPWRKTLVPKETLYVVFPGFGERWNARAVPMEGNQFQPKKPLPQSWAGLSGEDFKRVSGVESAIFCHRDRHLAAARSREDALKLAEIALNS